jgi:putative spermidine/putrescine transport system substrate-binding protein
MALRVLAGSPLGGPAGEGRSVADRPGVASAARRQPRNQEFIVGSARCRGDVTRRRAFRNRRAISAAYVARQRGRSRRAHVPPGTGKGGKEMGKARSLRWCAATAAAALTAGAGAGAASGAGAAVRSEASTSASCWATAASVASCGGMSALVAAAKKEGQLNVITLPSDWANYGTIMSDFRAKYGIHITDANPDGSSQDEINAMESLKGQSRDPDVLDMGTSFAIEADQKGLLAPYKVAEWSWIPASAKAADATWYDDYGGYVAIGYDPSKVKVAPTSFRSLLNPMYKGMIGINGNPTEAGAAFAAVYAAALANGGSLSDIAPGIKYFAKLHSEGNFVPVTGSESTVASGQTPILIWWDYLLATEVQSEIKGFKIVVPTDAHYAGYYSQAVNKQAPDPAAARLWEEYLYSTTGQNLWLEGFTRPIELAHLESGGTVNKAALAKLPAVSGSQAITLPTPAELNAAEALVLKEWTTEVG